MNNLSEYVAILDFGSQVTQLIARRVRENNVYCEIFPYNVNLNEFKKNPPKGIILSGGPASVYVKNAPKCSAEIFSLGVPVLGICYGMQLGCLLLNADVKSAKEREYGKAFCEITDAKDLFSGLPAKIQVWMSHGDRVENITKQFSILARTENTAYAAVRHKTLPFYGVQFHPEVVHTPLGSKIMHNFLYNICRCKGEWKMSSYIDAMTAQIKKQVGKGKVICALSGGVDSSVVALLIHKAIGKRLVCVFVDNGLLRKNEAEAVVSLYRKKFRLNFYFVDATRLFLNALKNVTDPEKKRKIIGYKFIEVFRKKAKEFKGIKFLAQGTLYPDVIESRSVWGGPTSKIKSHHNVGGLPEKLGFELIEPLKYLFKDEARLIAKELGMPDSVTHRQPFPGPGLAVRFIGAINEGQLSVLREADEIVRIEIENAGAQKGLWQYFAVLLPVQTVGVMGDERTYQNTVAIRVVESLDGMTADWSKLPHELLGRISSRIINEVKGVNRVVYDISTKPPSTIEWE
ncbi:MAG: glutamine-hydrolyzing GMP synthase [Planctomycetes bacterium]|nr:glutamine-hydrolyzing GMP synthase [Planctomycetota bacterium]